MINERLYCPKCRNLNHVEKWDELSVYAQNSLMNILSERQLNKDDYLFCTNCNGIIFFKNDQRPFKR